MNLSVGSSIVDSGSNVSGVCIKLVRSALDVPNHPMNSFTTHLVIRSNMDFGSRIKVGRVILLRSAPGRSCDIIDSRTAPISISPLLHPVLMLLTIFIPLSHNSLLLLLDHLLGWCRQFIATACFPESVIPRD